MADDERRRGVIRQWERMAEPAGAGIKGLSKTELSAIREAYARMALAKTPGARTAAEKTLFALLSDVIPAGYPGDDDD